MSNPQGKILIDEAMCLSDGAEKNRIEKLQEEFAAQLKTQGAQMLSSSFFAGDHAKAHEERVRQITGVEDTEGTNFIPKVLIKNPLVLKYMIDCVNSWDQGDIYIPMKYKLILLEAILTPGITVSIVYHERKDIGDAADQTDIYKISSEESGEDRYIFMQRKWSESASRPTMGSGLIQGTGLRDATSLKETVREYTEEDTVGLLSYLAEKQAKAAQTHTKFKT